VKTELGERCFKGLRVADAELDLDLNRLHGMSLYRFYISLARSEMREEHIASRSNCGSSTHDW
jgi:hypothetical protein